MATRQSTKVTLTDKKLESLKPKAQVYELADAGAKGLRVRVTPTGRIQFRWIYREEVGGKIVQRVAKLGEYPGTTLAEARLKLQEEKRRRSRSRGPAKVCASVQALAEEFRDEELKDRKDGGAEAFRLLELYVLPQIGKMNPRDVTPDDISHLVVKAARKAPVRAGKVLQLTRTMFQLAVDPPRKYVVFNPALGLTPKRHGVRKFKARKRSLSADDIKAFYAALEKTPRMSEPLKLAYKLLLITAVRSGELLRAEWKNVDLDQATWTIPPEHQKVRPEKIPETDPFVIPLPNQAVELFEQLKIYAEKSRFVMASSKAESGRYDDKSLGHGLRRLFELKVSDKPLLDIERFSPHDLRRSAQTHLLDTLDVDETIAERILNHKVQGVRRHYDRGERLRQRKEALQRWADWIDRVVGADTTVRELRA
jgi:integrase